MSLRRALRRHAAALALAAGAAAALTAPAPAQQPFTDLEAIPAPVLRDAFMLKVVECHLDPLPEAARPIPTATGDTGAFFAPGRSEPFLTVYFELLRTEGVNGEYYFYELGRGATLEEILAILTIGNLGVIFPGQPCPERRG